MPTDKNLFIVRYWPVVPLVLAVLGLEFDGFNNVLVVCGVVWVLVIGRSWHSYRKDMYTFDHDLWSRGQADDTLADKYEKRLTLVKKNLALLATLACVLAYNANWMLVILFGAVCILYSADFLRKLQIPEEEPDPGMSKYQSDDD